MPALAALHSPNIGSEYLYPFEYPNLPVCFLIIIFVVVVVAGDIMATDSC